MVMPSKGEGEVALRGLSNEHDVVITGEHTLLAPHDPTPLPPPAVLLNFCGEIIMGMFLCVRLWSSKPNESSKVCICVSRAFNNGKLCSDRERTLLSSRFDDDEEDVERHEDGRIGEEVPGERQDDVSVRSLEECEWLALITPSL